MTWDITTPLGTESKSQGDDRIRELKTDVQTALRGNAATGVEAIFPGSDTANPVFRYRGLKGTTGARPAAGQYGLYINETLNTIQRDNGASWVDVATLIPSGTVMVFFQAAAPVGWTKLVTQNDKALRVVSGAGGGSGGTDPVSTPGAVTTSGHVHTGPSHTHSTPAHTHTLAQGSAFANDALSGTVSITSDAGPGGVIRARAASGASSVHEITATTNSDGSGTSGAGGTGNTGSSTDSVTPNALQYIDVLICSKD